MARPRDPDLTLRRPAGTRTDRVAFAFVRVLRFLADTFFARRYGHRAVVLETVAAVPGMVGATLVHLRSLRRMEDDEGWIRSLLDEAENERMHLMTFIEIARPSALERLLVLAAQGVFYNAYFVLYLVSPGTAHRVVGYFEEEAIVSYTAYLAEIDAGRHADVPAPERAREYWNLAPDAALRDVVVAVRADEAGHRDANHAFADRLRGRKTPVEPPSGDEVAIGVPAGVAEERQDDRQPQRQRRQPEDGAGGDDRRPQRHGRRVGAHGDEAGGDRGEDIDVAVEQHRDRDGRDDEGDDGQHAADGRADDEQRQAAAGQQHLGHHAVEVGR